MNINEEAKAIQVMASELAVRAIEVLAAEAGKMRISVALLNELPAEGLTASIASAAGLLDDELRGACDALIQFRKTCEGEVARRRAARK